jgi:formate dehydrogenase subunit gamma
MSELRTVERFRKPTIIYHWLNTVAFVVLLATGAILLIPGFGIAASGGVTRLIHRIMVLIYVITPIIYTLRFPETTLQFIRETFHWGKDDIDWLKAAPDYYFGGDPAKMPAQGHINSGQKAWQMVALGTGILFIITGFIMMFLQGIVAPGVYSVCLVIHDVAFFTVFVMLLVHVYLGVIHPRMNESLRSMIDGKVSSHYAQDHYGKWYRHINKDKDHS